jgi:hypothetical protein
MPDGKVAAQPRLIGPGVPLQIEPERNPVEFRIPVELDPITQSVTRFVVLSDSPQPLSLEPGVSPYWIDLAQILGQMHGYNDAVIAARRARAAARTPQEQDRADAVIGMLEGMRTGTGQLQP